MTGKLVASLFRMIFRTFSLRDPIATVFSILVCCSLGLVTVTPGYADLVSTAVNVTGPEFTALNNVVVQTFTDTNSADTVAAFNSSVNWGDGTISAGTITGSNGSFSVAGSHTYGDELLGTISTTTTRTADNSQAISDSSATINEADVLNGTGDNISFTPGVAVSNALLATFTDSISGNPPSDFTAIIDWGDGTMTAGIIALLGGSYQISGEHTYSMGGPFSVSVTMSDDAPGTATAMTLASATSVPEPSSAMLLVICFGLIVLVRCVTFSN
jgi:hypothetical protein